MSSKKITKDKKKLKIESDSEDEEEEQTIKITKRNIISPNDVPGFYEFENDKMLINLSKLVKYLKKEGLKTTTKDEKEFLLNNNYIKDYIKEYPGKIRIMKTDNKTPFEMLKSVYFDFDEGL